MSILSKEKTKCDVCSKKVKARHKKAVMGELELHYLWCSKCKTVFPTFIIDAKSRENSRRVEELQEELFGFSTRGNDSETMGERAAKIDEIRRLKLENNFQSKKLVQQFSHLFELLPGDRVVIK